MATERGLRLQRFLAMTGVASRRKSEDLIAAGLVSVNGRVVTTPGTTVDPDRDEVSVGGKVVRPARSEDGGETVLALHKPAGTITARASQDGEPTVYDLIDEPAATRLIYVGRLDKESEGLLLLTTDGELAHRLTHPSWEVERVYEARVAGPFDERRLPEAARKGVVLDDGERTAPFRARILGRSGRAVRLELVLAEGRKREVRRIVSALGGRVERLVRTRYGTVELERLAPGTSRRLTRVEVARLRALVGLGKAERAPRRR